MYYLSFDPANKSLAVGLYYINPDWQSNYKYIFNNLTIDNLEQSNNDLDQLIQILYLDVIDMMPNRKVEDVSLIERSLLLKQTLTRINTKISEFNIDSIINVCIEYQLNLNNKSLAVYSQLIYEYSDINKYKIKCIKPSMKNSITINKDLNYSNYISKYTTNYKANKIHSKDNFLYFIKTFGLNDKIKTIKKKNLDDIADTFTQMMSTIIYKI